MNNSELYKMLDTRLASMEEHNRKIEEHKGNLLSLRDRTGSASRFPMLAKWNK